MNAKFVFWFIRRMFRPFAARRTCCQILHENPGVVAVPRFLQILNESLEIMNQTTNPGTFFCRYNTALDMAERMIEHSFEEEHSSYAKEIRDWLQLETDRIAVDFVNRCKAKGNLLFVQDELFSNDTVFSEKAKAYLSEVLMQIGQE